MAGGDATGERASFPISTANAAIREAAGVSRRGVGFMPEKAHRPPACIFLSGHAV
jgi:hypothetical protein